MAAPLVTVVLCVRNGAATLAAQLHALASQRIESSWELVLVDNGSSDESVAIAETFRDRLPALRVVPALDSAGLGYARNVGAAAAAGELLAFCDADDEVRPDWLAALTSGLSGADLAGGHLDIDRINSDAARFWRGDSPTARGLPQGHGHLPHVLGANFAVHRDVYAALGGCDECFVGSSDDVDLSWRAQEAGYRIAFVDSAVVDYRLRVTSKAIARQQFGYGKSEAILFRKHRPRMARQSLTVVASEYRYLFLRLDHLVRSRQLRAKWLSVAAYRAGRLRGSWREHVFFP